MVETKLKEPSTRKLGVSTFISCTLGYDHGEHYYQKPSDFVRPYRELHVAYDLPSALKQNQETP